MPNSTNLESILKNISEQKPTSTEIDVGLTPDTLKENPEKHEFNDLFQTQYDISNAHLNRDIKDYNLIYNVLDNLCDKKKLVIAMEEDGRSDELSDIWTECLEQTKLLSKNSLNYNIESLDTSIVEALKSSKIESPLVREKIDFVLNDLIRNIVTSMENIKEKYINFLEAMTKLITIFELDFELIKQDDVDKYSDIPQVGLTEEQHNSYQYRNDHYIKNLFNYVNVVDAMFKSFNNEKAEHYLKKIIHSENSTDKEIVEAVNLTSSKQTQNLQLHFHDKLHGIYLDPTNKLLTVSKKDIKDIVHNNDTNHPYSSVTAINNEYTSTFELLYKKGKEDYITFEWVENRTRYIDNTEFTIPAKTTLDGLANTITYIVGNKLSHVKNLINNSMLSNVSHYTEVLVENNNYNGLTELCIYLKNNASNTMALMSYSDIIIEQMKRDYVLHKNFYLKNKES